MHKPQSGFTLVELIIVIAILGVLGATALPKITSLQAHARIAKMQGILAAMKSASNIGHSLLLANNYPANYSGNPGEVSGTTDINVEGIDVVYKNGYPDATSLFPLAGIAVADTPTESTSVSGATVGVVTSDLNHPLCKIIYTPASNTGSTYVGPTFDASNLTIDNCN